MTVTPYSYYGQPPDTLGVQDDQCIDYQNHLLWGPKGATSWAGTSANIVGPTGPQGPPAASAVMTNLGSGYGPASGFNGQSVATGTQVCYFAGTTIPNTFTPTINSALTGVAAANYSATGAAVTVLLLDTTTGSTVLTIASVASNSTTKASYTASAYPLIAGHTYQWAIQRSGAGVVYLQIYPTYLFPSGTPSNLSTYQPFLVTTSTTIAKAAVINTTVPGMALQAFYANPNPSWLYQLDIYMAGSGIADPFLYNNTAGANQFTCDNYYYPSLTSTLTKYTFGPFSPMTWPFVASSQYVLNIYAQSALTVTQAYALITVGQ